MRDSETISAWRNAADDNRLIARVRTGDAGAFESLFRDYVAPLTGLAFSYLHSHDAAEEAVQDVFVALWNNRHSFHPLHGIRAYLFGAVRNRALNTLRDESTRVRALASLAEQSPVSAPSADAQVIDADLNEQVQAIVASMPPRCREVFTLVRTQALPYVEVAAMLGIAPKTVEVHMSRALAILRARLGSQMDGFSST